MAYDLSRLFNLLCQHLNSSPGMSLTTLSLHIRIERHTIERTIKSVSRMTFRQLRNHLMLERAKVLMRTRPDLNIKEIAFELNYGSHRAFSRFIKESACCSPSELRQRALFEKPGSTSYPNPLEAIITSLGAKSSTDVQ
jgi:AraC-like DNA-binding protein